MSRRAFHGPDNSCSEVIKVAVWLRGGMIAEAIHSLLSSAQEVQSRLVVDQILDEEILVVPILQVKDAIQSATVFSPIKERSIGIFCSSEAVRLLSRAPWSTLAGKSTYEDTPADFLAAIRQVSEGGAWTSARLSQGSGSSTFTDCVRGSELSEREHQILELVRIGLRLSEIAIRLGVSAKTVSSHFENMKNKLGLQDASSLRAYARGDLQEGLGEGI